MVDVSWRHSGDHGSFCVATEGLFQQKCQHTVTVWHNLGLGPRLDTRVLTIEKAPRNKESEEIYEPPSVHTRLVGQTRQHGYVSPNAGIGRENTMYLWLNATLWGHREPISQRTDTTNLGKGRNDTAQGSE